MNDFEIVLINVLKNFLIDHLESHIMRHIVFTSHDRTPSSLTYLPPPIQPTFILCCPYAHWNMVGFLVARPVREDESFSLCI